MSTTQEPTTESDISIIVPKQKMSDGETKMDSNKPEKEVEFVQADQEPLAESQDDHDSKVKF